MQAYIRVRTTGQRREIRRETDAEIREAIREMNTTFFKFPTQRRRPKIERDQIAIVASYRDREREAAAWGMRAIIAFDEMREARSDAARGAFNQSLRNAAALAWHFAEVAVQWAADNRLHIDGAHVCNSEVADVV